MIWKVGFIENRKDPHLQTMVLTRPSSLLKLNTSIHKDPLVRKKSSSSRRQSAHQAFAHFRHKSKPENDVRKLEKHPLALFRFDKLLQNPSSDVRSNLRKTFSRLLSSSTLKPNLSIRPPIHQKVYKPSSGDPYSDNVLKSELNLKLSKAEKETLPSTKTFGCKVLNEHLKNIGVKGTILSMSQIQKLSNHFGNRSKLNLSTVNNENKPTQNLSKSLKGSLRTLCPKYKYQNLLSYQDKPVVNNKVCELNLAIRDRNLIIHIPQILHRLNESIHSYSLFVINKQEFVFDVSQDEKIRLYNILAKCVFELKVGERSWFLAVDLFEHVLVCCEVNTESYLPVALACLLIAAKFENIRCPSVSDFFRSAYLETSKRQFILLEEYILKLFDFNIISTLSYDYYTIFSQIAGLPEKAKQLGTFMLRIYLCRLQRYQKNRALVAFSVCKFLTNRFKTPQFWSEMKRHGKNCYALLIIPGKKFGKHSTDKIWNQASEFFFDAGETDRLCDEITDACIRCHVEDHSWIFQLFAHEKTRCFCP